MYLLAKLMSCCYPQFHEHLNGSLILTNWSPLSSSQYVVWCYRIFLCIAVFSLEPYHIIHHNLAAAHCRLLFLLHFAQCLSLLSMSQFLLVSLSTNVLRVYDASAATASWNLLTVTLKNVFIFIIFFKPPKCIEIATTLRWCKQFLTLLIFWWHHWFWRYLMRPWFFTLNWIYVQVLKTVMFLYYFISCFIKQGVLIIYAGPWWRRN